MPIRIIIADDLKLMRKGLRAILGAVSGISVVAEAKNGAEAIALVRKHRPDVALMDITMPVLDGIEATRRITAESPGTKVVALTMHTDKALTSEILRAGAANCVKKDCDLDVLVKTIRAVVKKKASAASGKPKRAAAKGPMPALLTDREREILSLIGGGFASKEIAWRLKLSPKTVETHRMHIMLKLGLHTAAELTRYAILHGLSSA